MTLSMADCSRSLSWTKHAYNRCLLRRQDLSASLYHLYQACLRGDVTEAAQSLRGGANPNKLPQRYRDILHTVPPSEKMPLGLTEGSAGVSDDDLERPSCLTLAIRSGNISLVRLLLDNGADPNLGVHSSILRDLQAALPFLRPARTSPLPTRPQESSLPLIHACRDQNIELVNLLLKYGARVNLRDRDGLTAAGVEQLYKSFNYTSVKEIFNLLIEYNGNLNDICNASGQSPVQLACQYGNHVVLRFLIERGVDIRCDFPRACIDYACRSGSGRVLQCLLDAGLVLPQEDRIYIPDTTEGVEICEVLLKRDIFRSVVLWAVRNHQDVFLRSVLRRSRRTYPISLPQLFLDTMTTPAAMMLVSYNLISMPEKILKKSRSDEESLIIDLFMEAIDPIGYFNGHLSRQRTKFETINPSYHGNSKDVISDTSRCCSSNPPSLLLLSVHNVRKKLFRQSQASSLSIHVSMETLPLPTSIKHLLLLEGYVEGMSPTDRPLPSVHDQAPPSHQRTNKHQVSPDAAVIFFMLFMAFITLVLHIWKYCFECQCIAMVNV